MAVNCSNLCLDPKHCERDAGDLKYGNLGVSSGAWTKKGVVQSNGRLPSINNVLGQCGLPRVKPFAKSMMLEVSSVNDDAKVVK
jgi:hypothetical protein